MKYSECRPDTPTHVNCFFFRMSDLQPSARGGGGSWSVLKLKGEDGVSSQKRSIKGERGQDLTVKVPLGTSVCDMKGMR